MRDPLRVFIGYDSKEPVAFHVLCHSILRHTDTPIAITPLALDHLHGTYTRPRGPTESTEFSISRFLVPYLCGYQGHAVFMDCDMLVQTNLVELWAYALAYPGKAVHVCQHDYTPKSATKFLGQPQTTYPRKNWSSLMVFDTAQCQALTPAYVNAATGLELHRFHWLHDAQIGALPLEWNYLVDEYPPCPDAKNLHFTNGGPWFPEYAACDSADAWFAERDRMLGLPPARGAY